MSGEPTERFNHTGLRVHGSGFRYDVDKIDDELGIITEHGVTLVHDRKKGELLIEQERQVSNDELRALIVQLRSERADLVDRECATDSAQAHRNGVMAGMEYAADQLEELVDE